jgi:hypothetical protein
MRKEEQIDEVGRKRKPLKLTWSAAYFSKYGLNVLSLRRQRSVGKAKRSASRFFAESSVKYLGDAQ